MMKHSYKLVLALMLGFAYNPLSAQACKIGGICGWLAELCGCSENLDEIEEVLEYIVLEGKEFCVDVFNNTVNTLTNLYKENPTAFAQFFEYCVAGTTSQLPQDLVKILKDYDLLQQDATVSDALQTIVSWVVEFHADGNSARIWLLEELIKHGFTQIYKRPVSKKV